MRRTLLGFITSFSAFAVQAQCSELFISEYVEGSRNNKALEIYNPTESPVDLSQYRITRWQNGSASWTPQYSDALTGTLAPKDVLVVVLDRRDTTQTGQDTPVVLDLRLKADLFLSKDYNTSYSMSFNGDDALSLDKKSGANYVPVDIFGRIGERPNPAWSDSFPYNNGLGLWYTINKTLIRKPSVMTGVTKNPSSFNPSVEWNVHPQNMFDSLGMHECGCNTLSVSEWTQEIPVWAFPNPAQSALSVMGMEVRSAVAINAAGQSFAVALTPMAGYAGAVLNVESLSAGIYTLQLAGLEGSRSIRFVKE
ncbi:MAG: lamin tail domain-containing protein [Bacteroidia bacterium]